MGSKPRFVETTREGRRAAAVEERDEPSLVLAYHPRLSRVGATIALSRRVVEISRLAPSFDGEDSGPIDDPYVSRQPFVVRRLARGGVEVDNPHGVELAVSGSPLPAGSPRRLSEEDVARGVDITLGDRVLFWLGPTAPPAADDLGLAGRSRALESVRAEIRDTAGPGPTLVLGESGVGKELVARAIHATSARSNGPFVVVNVAAIPAAVAVAELFGHERGAFTGAGERRAGYFERAAGGVLFLDEVGELPETIQPVLLRALESGEIQPVGGQPRRVDAQVVAATDADLEKAVARARFRGPLYFRLAARTIRVPPLRERRLDIAVLLAQFLIAALPEAMHDQTTEAALSLPASHVAELMRRAWPGNVRQLRAAAEALAANIRSGRPAELRDLGADAEDLRVPPAPASAPIDDARLVAALRAHHFQLNRTAEALGVSRTHLDLLIARCPNVRKAKDLAREEIVACGEALDNDVDAMAAELEVSPRGLRLRMRQLGM